MVVTATVPCGRDCHNPARGFLFVTSHVLRVVQLRLNKEPEQLEQMPVPVETTADSPSIEKRLAALATKQNSIMPGDAATLESEH